MVLAAIEVSVVPVASKNIKKGDTPAVRIAVTLSVSGPLVTGQATPLTGAADATDTVTLCAVVPPAPVQVSMIGYMQTTGMSAMDYRVTDENMDPAGVSDGFSSEKLVRLATGAATFRPPVQCPEVNESPVLHRRALGPLK